ncbi:transposase [Paraburkholderia youngii]
MNKDAPQRRYELREMFNALRWIVRAGAPWRLLPNNFPPWELVYQQTQRWIQAGCFEAMVSDLRSILRVAQDRRGQPSAVILDGRTRQSTCESGARAGYVGYKRKKGSKVHMVVDTLGQLLAVHVTPANEQERAGWRTGASGPAGHGPDGQGGVRGSGIYRRRARAGGA